LQRGGELIAPPGSEVALALLIGMTGLLIGLAMPTQIATINLFRVLVSDGATAFISALQAFPRPTPALVSLAVGIVLACVAFSGGWIRSALALVRGEDVTEATWKGGQREVGRIFGWNLVIIAWLVLVGLMGGEVGYLAIKSGLSASRGGEILAPSLIGIGGLAMWAFTLGAAVYYLAVSCLGAIVAVAEPRTAFWNLFRRAPTLFMNDIGWGGLGQFVAVLAGWWTAKVVMTQFLLPFWPVPFGGPTWVFGVAGALLQAGLALGDGMILLLVVLMGAVVYEEAARLVDRPATDDETRKGRLKPWPLLPGRRL
jgi:hypothetical protein